MGNTFAPFGLLKSRGIVSCEADAMNPYTIASGYNTAIAFDDLVKSDGVGGIVKCEAGNTPLGTFKGVHFTAADGTYQYKKYWTAGTVLAAGTKAFALVDDSPMAMFEVQCQASILEADRGAFVDILDNVAADPFIGQSKMSCSPAAAYGPVTSFSGITGGTGHTVGETVILTPQAGDTLGKVTTTTVATVSSGAVATINLPPATALFMLAPVVSFPSGAGAAATAVLTTANPTQCRVERIIKKSMREADSSNNTIGYTETTEGQYAVVEVKFAKHERGGTSLATAV